MKSVGNRENRWMQDVNHQVSKALVLSHPNKTMFVLGDLTGIRAATERVHKRDRYASVNLHRKGIELIVPDAGLQE